MEPSGLSHIPITVLTVKEAVELILSHMEVTLVLT
jgi:hypothetical protein